MKPFYVSFFLLFVLLSNNSTTQAQVKVISVEDFFRNPEKAYYQISPDGQHIAHTEPYENRMNVFVQKIGDDRVWRVTSLKDRDISEYFWKGNQRILYFRDFGGDENFHLFKTNIDGTGETDLTPFEGKLAYMIDDLSEHETDVIIATNKRNPEIFDVYRLNTESGEMKLIAENPGNITSWLTDHEGKIRAAGSTDGVNNSLLFRENENEDFKTIVTTNFKENLNPLFFTFDNKNLYAASNIDRDKTAIVEIDPRTGKELNVLFAHPEVDVEGLDYSKHRKCLTEISYVTWKPERKVLDQLLAKHYRFLATQFPDYEIYITSTDKSEKLMIVRTVSDKSLGAYYFYNAETGEIQHLSDRNPWLDENIMASMKPIQYTSRDGLTINGYLTLPKNVAPKNLPIVVNPHGGPWARDVWGFNSEVQFLANRGYAVLQMNFRGSTGYGKQFWEASFKEWGQKMQDDISDGVKYLIEEGIADPERVCIYGGSYGGYATLAGLAFTPELYACGIDYVGVSNMFTFMNTIPPYWEPFRDMFYEMVGDPEKDKAMLEAVSPVMHAENINVPLLIAQGAKDPRVNVAESDQMVEAMRQRGIEVEYIVKENEGHGFHNEENRFEFYRAMEDFLRKHL
ncbi:MAG: S9 family peptidase [Chitinophagales bacterium]|nr:S9 family peptidase [Bacteroidota bacterium]